MRQKSCEAQDSPCHQQLSARNVHSVKPDRLWAGARANLQGQKRLKGPRHPLQGALSKRFVEHRPQSLSSKNIITRFDYRPHFTDREIETSSGFPKFLSNSPEISLLASTDPDLKGELIPQSRSFCLHAGPSTQSNNPYPVLVSHISIL